MNAILAQALAYAAHGWPVFPCRPDFPGCPDPGGCQCKAPMTAHGFQDASTDPAVIRSWWSRWPRANVAIRTGQPAVDVLDVDVRPGGSGWPAFNRLKRAGLLSGALALVRTPSGGLHAYYAGTAQSCRSLSRAGHYLDLKAADGYVLAPPSIVHGRPYEVIDHRAADGRIDWQAVVRLLGTSGTATSSTRNTATSPTRNAAGLVEWVAALPTGRRNAGLFWAACRMAEAHAPAGEYEQLIAAAVQAGLSEDEARRTVGSAVRKAAG